MTTTGRPYLCSGECYNQSLKLTQSLAQQQYSTDLIPSTSDYQPLTIFILFALVKIINLENTGILSTACVLNMYWYDKRLMWNSSNYGDLVFIQIKSSKIWTPILNLLNPAGNSVNFPINTEPVWIRNDSRVQGIISSQFVSACAMDLTKFPYDTQICYLEFTDMNYWSTMLVYQAQFEKATLGLYVPSEEWTVISTGVHNSSRIIEAGNGEYNYFATLQVSLKLARKSAYYTVVLVFPTILLECLLFFVFFLPCGSVLKVTLSASLVLTMYVLQKTSTSEIPSFDVSKYPLIILGLCAGMGLGAMVLVTSVVSVTMSQLDVAVPQLFKRGQVNPQHDGHQSRTTGEVVVVIEDKDDSTKEDASETSKLSAGVQELLKIKREHIKERKKKCEEESNKRKNTTEWRRVEMYLSFSAAVVYLVAGVSFTATCVVQ